MIYAQQYNNHYYTFDTHSKHTSIIPLLTELFINGQTIVNAGDDDEEEGEEGEEAEEKMPTCGDYIMHFLTLFWKVLFATIPPAGTNELFLFEF
jgi:hypothetical protein